MLAAFGVHGFCPAALAQRVGDARQCEVHQSCRTVQSARDDVIDVKRGLLGCLRQVAVLTTIAGTLPDSAVKCGGDSRAHRIGY